MLRFDRNVLDSRNRAILELDVRIAILQPHNGTHRIALRQAGYDASNSVIIPSPVTLKLRQLH